LLDFRAREISPHLKGAKGGKARYDMLGASAFIVNWPLGSGATLRLIANFGREDCAIAGSDWGELRPIYESRVALPAAIVACRLPAASVLFALRELRP
jgi:hypothetical protein